MIFPERILSYGNWAKKTTEFNAMYKKMVDSYMMLPFHLGVEALPHNPKEIDAARLKGYCEKMMTGLNEDQKNVWRKLYSDAIVQIKILERFFEAFPDAEFQINDNVTTPRENWLTCVNKTVVIKNAAEVDVPEDCKAYFEKVQSFASALNEMREYEKSHNIQKHSIEEMAYYVDHFDEFAKKYVDGYFDKKS